jgi:hypothetical protein
MIIDGVNVADYDIIVGDRRVSRSAAATRQIIEGAPGAWRRRHLGNDPPEALAIAVDGGITGSSLANLRSNIDRLKFMLRPDKEVAIRWSDMTGDNPVRQWLGYRQELVIEDIPPGWLQDVVKFNLLILCPDPFARETTEQSPSTSGTVPLVVTPTVGTAPMPVIITVTRGTANIVNPVLHYRNGANQDIYTISYAGTLASGQTLVIDTEHFTAKVNSINVGGNISGTYFDINPGDGDFLGSPTGPDVQLTADSGQASNFELAYYRRYW